MSALPDFSSAAANRASRPDSRGRAWLAAGGFALLLAGGAAFYQQADLDSARAELAQARRTLAERGKSRARGRDDGRAQAFAAQQRVTAAAPPARVLADLQAVQPRGVRFERIELHYAQNVTVDLQVVARGAAEYDRLLAALEKSKAFADVTPGAENREGEVRSSLSLRYVGPGA